MVVLICLSLMIIDVVHLLMSLLAIILLMEKSLFRSSANFLVTFFFWGKGDVEILATRREME